MMQIVKRVRNRIVNICVGAILDYGEKKGVFHPNRITYDLNLDATQKQQRILVCYINYSDATKSLRKGATHTNQPRLLQILRVFYELNLVVDVCACNDTKAAEELDFSKYDYIFGFGKVFEQACKSAEGATKIIYMTEDPYYIAKTREEERIAYFLKRHADNSKQRELQKFSNTRAGFFYPPEQEKLADVIVTQGNETYFSDTKASVFTIVPNAFKNNRFNLDLNMKKERSFVMFGGSSLIRKGTDILVDVFSTHPDWELYLCDSGITEKLKKLGYNELPSNIHDCGFLDIEGDKVIELFQKCRFIVLPSCSEAPSSAVLTGMRHGLIPIVTRGIGLDKFNDFCMYFDDYHVEHVEQKLESACAMSVEELNNRSEKIYKYANENFTLEQFTVTMKEIMNKVINNY